MKISNDSQLLGSSFRILCLLVIHWFLFVLHYVYLEASSLDVIFSLALHYNTLQPKARSASSSLVFEHKPNVVGERDLVDLRMQCGCGFDCGKSVGRVCKVQMCLECGVQSCSIQLLQHIIVGESLQKLSSRSNTRIALMMMYKQSLHT